MSTIKELSTKSVKELKEIALEYGVEVVGDKRKKDSWIEAILKIKQPLSKAKKNVKKDNSSKPSNKLIPSPFLKYSGGKTQLLKQFDKLYPQKIKKGEITKYFELFLGGGAVFFDLVRRYSIDRVFLCDLNQDLILTYKVIRSNAEELIESLALLQEQYLKRTHNEKKAFYYQIRQQYNEQQASIDRAKISVESILRASYFIFLNKTGFNGLHRVNQKGNFNVPWGQYKTPRIYNQNLILQVSKVLQKVVLRSGNYDTFSDLIDDKSFVYLDPPYRPISKTSSFTTYSNSPFSDLDQIKLKEYCDFLSNTLGAKIMLSNSNPHNTNPKDNFFHDLYANYTIEKVYANRAINSKSSKRGKLSELAIMNYQ